MTEKRVNLVDHRKDLDSSVLRCHSVKLLGSANGLVCVSIFHHHFFVINPSISEVRLVEPLGLVVVGTGSGTLRLGGFGYNALSDDYVIVAGLYDKYDKVFTLRYFTLKGNLWTTFEQPVPHYSSDDDEEGWLEGGIECNGSLHWILRDEKFNKNIFSYEISTHSCKVIHIPHRFHQVKNEYILGTVHGCLSLILSRNLLDFEMWVLTKSNVEDLWQKWSQPAAYDATKQVLSYEHMNYPSGYLCFWLLDDGSAEPRLLKRLGWSGNFFNVEHVNLLTLSECNYNFHWHKYSESRVSPLRLDDDGSGSRPSFDSEDEEEEALNNRSLDEEEENEGGLRMLGCLDEHEDTRKKSSLFSSDEETEDEEEEALKNRSLDEEEENEGGLRMLGCLDEDEDTTNKSSLFSSDEETEDEEEAPKKRRLDEEEEKEGMLGMPCSVGEETTDSSVFSSDEETEDEEEEAPKKKYGDATSTQLAGKNLEGANAIQQIRDMGGGSALRAAFNNPERADIEYAIPEAVEVPPLAGVLLVPVINPPVQAPQATQAAAAPTSTTGPNADPLDLFPQGLHDMGGNALTGAGDDGNLDFVQNIPQFEAFRAMPNCCASFYNPESDFEYVEDGETAREIVGADSEEGIPEADEVPAGGQNAYSLNFFSQGLPDIDLNALNGNLDFLRDVPQFQAFRAMTQAIPRISPESPILQVILRELAKQYPLLARLIQERFADFLSLVNEPLIGGELGKLISRECRTVTVTPEERGAIDRLEERGHERERAVEVFVACFKNEEIAAEYLDLSSGVEKEQKLGHQNLSNMTCCHLKYQHQCWGVNFVTFYRFVKNDSILTSY